MSKHRRRHHRERAPHKEFGNRIDLAPALETATTKICPGCELETHKTYFDGNVCKNCKAFARKAS